MIDVDMNREQLSSVNNDWLTVLFRLRLISRIVRMNPLIYPLIERIDIELEIQYQWRTFVCDDEFHSTRLIKRFLLPEICWDHSRKQSSRAYFRVSSTHKTDQVLILRDNSWLNIVQVSVRENWMKSSSKFNRIFHRTRFTGIAILFGLVCPCRYCVRSVSNTLNICMSTISFSALESTALTTVDRRDWLVACLFSSSRHSSKSFTMNLVRDLLDS
jgi:hypothetical protein